MLTTQQNVEGSLGCWASQSYLQGLRMVTYIVVFLKCPLLITDHYLEFTTHDHFKLIYINVTKIACVMGAF